MELKGEMTLLRELRPEDAPALEAMVSDPEVRRFLPTFLEEMRHEDMGEAVRAMRDSSHLDGGSTFLAVCPAGEPEVLAGIAEVYDYLPEKPKASIGCRFAREFWGHGFATDSMSLLRDHLVDQGIRTITAHIMVENEASAHAAVKCGFTALYRNIEEDWGFEEPVLVDTYVFKTPR